MSTFVSSRYAIAVVQIDAYNAVGAATCSVSLTCAQGINTPGATPTGSLSDDVDREYVTWQVALNTLDPPS